MRYLKTAFFSLFLTLAIQQPSLASGVPIANDLQADYGAEGFNQTGEKKVVLLLVSQPGCSYCVQITEEIIKPMIRSGSYEETTLFREIEINAGDSLKDFSGEEITSNSFARRYNAWATPTLLFLDSTGNELAEKMVGVNTLELYGYYVDKSLRNALKKLNP